jgi:hypothetical protein
MRRGLIAPQAASRGLLAGLALSAALWFASLRAYQAPAASGLETPVGEFSAARALQDLHDLLREEQPHPLGSAAAARLRTRIVQRLEQLGIEPELQAGALICNRWGRCGVPVNIVARLPGNEDAADAHAHDPAPADADADADAVLLAAHYDSVPAGPGASDDAASVAAVIEVARALRSRPPTRHPIVLLIDEGEEAGLLGAQLFVSRHRYARFITSAVNLDARGTTGSSLLFETGSDNDWLIGLLAHARSRVLSNSVYYSAYRLTPHDTDFTVFRAAGWQGFNFAYIGGVARYHTPLDDLAHADARSLGQQGACALAAVRALADADVVGHPAGEAAYFDLYGRAIVRIPVAVLRPAAWFTLALLLLATARLVRQGALRSSALLWGGAAMLACCLLGLCGSEAALALLRAAHALPPTGGGSFIAQPGPAQVLFVALAGLLLALLAVLAQALAGFWGLWAASALAAGTLAALLSVWLPGASYLPWLPSLGGLAVMLLPLQVLRERAWARDCAALLLLVCSLTLLLPLCVPLYLALGVAALPVLCVILVCALPWLALLLMQAGATARALFVAGAVAGLVIGMLAALAVPAYTREQPERLNIRYELDATSGLAFWAVIPDSTRLPPELRAAAPFARIPAPSAAWLAQPAYRTPAPLLPLPAPSLSVLSSRRTASGWHLQLQIASVRGAPELLLIFPPEAAVRQVQVAKQPWPTAKLPGGGSFLDFLGTRPEGLRLELESDAPAFELVLQDQDYGLPEQGRFLERARPATTTPSQNGDVTIVSTRVRWDQTQQPLPRLGAERAQPGSAMSTAAAPMTAAAIQPSTMIGRLTVNGPITEALEASRMMSTISGTATTPLITALQNSARIGLIGRY